MTTRPGGRPNPEAEGTVYLPAVPPDATVVIPALSTETTGFAAPPPESGRRPVQPPAPEPAGSVYRSATYQPPVREPVHPRPAAPGTIYGRPAAPPGQPEPAEAPAGPAGPDLAGTQAAGTALPGAEMAGAAGADRAGSVARHGAVMAVGSLISRGTGALRTQAIAAAIGAGLVGNDYSVANMLPNMVYELLLGGVLASVVVPLLVRARSRDTDGGEAYTHRLVTLTTVFLGAATVLAVAAAPLITGLMANSATSAADRQLTTTLGYLLLPEIFFYGLAAVLAAVLNTRGHFAAPMWTPILNNIVVIITAGLFILVHGTSEPTAGALNTTEILILGAGTTLGIVVQAAGLWPALRRVGFRWRWRWDFRELHLSELARIGGWALCYVVASQVGVVAVLWIANYAGDRHGPGSMVYLNAYLILMMAHGIVAVSIITALMPRLAAAATGHRYGEVVDDLSLGTRLSAVLLIPATAAYIVLGRPLAVILFDWGAYGHRAALDTGTVIAWSALGLMPFAISQLQMFTFYAMPDTRTPALINIPAVAVRILFDLLFLVVLPISAVVNGLMAGNAISYLLACVIGYVLLRRRLGPLGLRGTGASLVRLGVAATAGMLVAGLAVLGLAGLMGTGKGASLLQVVVGGVLLAGVYLAVAMVLRAREVTQVSTMVRARLGR